ncbi:alpha/beta hydrolase [Nocardiopsis tropica]|uniref:Alpha/beta hydrolase n=1 Tax=Nocardiopsis tropica TaxID=109330 RepID=A0ABU7KUZ4_9ACTN|nr:alpha/beta hydrolase [Nocardiopsis umidischolae]MEE2053125.1 alpha/beta hydrolase [Nocardiopsis umidischolae]
MDHPHERGAGRRLVAAVGRRAALATACITALPGAAAAALVLLPPPSWDAWQYALLALEFSLVFAVPAAAGLLIALTVLFRLRGRSPRERDGVPAAGPSAGRGRRRLAAVAAAANAAVLAAALAPPAAIWSTARAEGARLSLAEYTAGLSTSADREPETRVYLRLDESGEEIADPSGSGAPEAAEELVLDVWEPERREDDAPLPIVVNVHGGADDLPQSLLPRWDTWLADGGRVVFDVDYRYFPDGDWSAPVSDVKCAVGWARAHAEEYGADPDRVAVTGQSAGGLLALLAGYTSAEEIPPSCDVPEAAPDAVVAWYSVADGTDRAPEVPWRQRHSPVGEDLDEGSVRMMGGTPEEVPEEYELISPLHQVSADSPPTLLVMSGHDLFLGTEDNRRMAARLDEAGVPHRYLEIPWAEHMFDLNWGGFASQLTRHTLDGFLTEHLAP